MTKATLNINADGAVSVSGFAAEFPISGDVLAQSGWKARAKLMDRAVEAFLASPKLAGQAMEYFSIPQDGPAPDPWDLAAKVNAYYPGGLPRFVSLPVDQARNAA